MYPDHAGPICLSRRAAIQHWLKLTASASVGIRLSRAQSTKVSGSAASTSEIAVKLVKELTHSFVHGISPDGAKLCLYFAQNPSRSFVWNGKWREKNMSLREGEDAFRVVEFGSWAQIRALRLRGHALAASFFADSESVYVETEPVLGGGRVETQRVRLDLGTGKDEQRIDPYSQQDAHTSYQAIQRTTLLGILDDVKSHMTEFLVRAELPSYRELQRVPFAEARDSAIGKTETPLAVSIDRATFAYSVDHTIVCRRTADLTSKWSQRVDPDVPLWHVAVSASGNFVGASMSGDATAAQRKGSCVAIYSGEDGRLVTQLPVSTQEPFAISPDGRLVAVGQRVNMPGKPSGTQPTVLIFDTDSARITSTLVQDQFRAGGREFLYAGFGRLEFTPDGKYLVTSGLNTKVWKIG